MPNPFIIHGSAMAIAWGIFGILMIATNRYLGAFWKYNVKLHALFGFIIVWVTIGFALYALSKVGWKLIINLHFYFIAPVALLVLFLAAGGTYTRFMLQNSVWNTQKALKIKAVHKTFAYVILTLATGAVMTGIYYYRINPKHAFTTRYEYYYLAYFVLIVGILETIKRFSQKSEKQYWSENLRPITIQQFEKRVSNGEELVILDDLILDVSKFQHEHPGGKFSISHNIGGDVSKFFYGGYSLENENKVQEHVHSNTARQVVNSLIIGRLSIEATKRIMKIDGVEDNGQTGPIKTLRFIETNKVDNVGDTYQKLNDVPLLEKQKCSLEDFSQIAKHYLLKSTTHPRFSRDNTPGQFKESDQGIKRHYTEAFCMREEIYQNLINLSETPDDAEVMSTIQTAIQTNNKENLCLTMKNYSLNRGLSWFVHKNLKDMSGQVYQIQGPMGHGLGIQTEGKHIALAAGTGILVFIDLVAHLILRLAHSQLGTAINVSESDDIETIDLDKFSFALYTSFSSPEEQIGLKLCIALENLCEKLGKPNLFQFIDRQHGQTTKLPRWDKAFYKKIIMDGQLQQTKKIWMCGPPLMQETFDREWEVCGNSVTKMVIL